jgi:hypothetical protein
MTRMGVAAVGAYVRTLADLQRITNAEVAEIAGKHIGGIRQILLPNWTDGTTWLTDSLKAAFKAENGGDYSTTVDGRLVSMNVITFGPTSAVVTFSISPAP